MSARILVACGLVLLAAPPASAHRLDEYLQASLIAVEKDRVRAELRLAPGVAVFPAVLAAIDRDADGVISATEQRAYAERVLGDLSLSTDGKRLPLRLISSKFPSQELLKEGLGEIQLRVETDVAEPSAMRRLTFVNQHQSAISVYLVNALLPRDPGIELGREQRSDDQSFYQVEYSSTGAASTFPFAAWLGWTALVLGVAALLKRSRRARLLTS